MEPSKQPLSNILPIGGTNESYRIPKYQRPYSWGVEDWQLLLDDIQDEGNGQEGHFMGSIICVDTSSGSPGEPRTYELIDGQQRLTTLSCLLVVLWSKFNKTLDNPNKNLDKKDLEDMGRIKDDLGRRIVREKRYPRDKNPPKISLPSNPTANPFFIGRRERTYYFSRILPSSQDSNRDDYLAGLHELGLLQDIVIEKPSNWGNRRIAKCLRYFETKLSNDPWDLKNLVEHINALVFIHIRVNSQSDAFQLFESINNRGVPLSALDIIKNAMLASLEHKETGSIDEGFERWSSMMQDLGSDSSVHESYLRHFYNAFQVESKRKVSGKNRATKSTLIEIFEKLIKVEAMGLLRDLEKRAKYYGAIIDPENKEDNKVRREKLLNLSRIEAKPGHQFLLYLLDRESIGKCKKTETNKIIDLIVSYFVRRNLTGIPATNRLDAVFINLVERCNNYLSNEGSELTFDVIREFILDAPRGDAPATEKDMRTALSGDIYWENSSIARYLLCKFVESRATKENDVDLWRRTDKGKFVWTIEHVLPQGDRLKKEWTQMLAKGDAEKAIEIQASYKDKLGNLTLSAYNSNLSDAPFLQKQQKTKITLDKEEAYIGYLNGLPLNNLKYKVDKKEYSLANTSTWNEQHILARGKILADEFMKAFPL